MVQQENVERTLSVASVKDFQVCSLFYDFRHRQHLPRPIYGRELMAQRYENTLRKVIAFFFYKKQSHVTPSYNSLLNRWEKLWFPKDMTAYDMAVEQHEVDHGNYATYSNAATLALLKFHEDFYHDQSEPILIEERYVVPIGRSVRLEGCIDLVLRNRQRYQVFLLSALHKRPAISSLLMDFAALKYAFEYRNETRRNAEYFLYDAGSNKPGRHDVRPHRKDIDALAYWAQEAITSDVYVPRRGYTSYCRGCPYDAECLAWKSWPEITS